MGDPQRLLSQLSDGDELERELLASIERADPPTGAKAEAWARVSAQIAAGAAVGTVASSAAAAGTSAAAEGAKAAAGSAAKAALGPAMLQILGSKAVLALAVAGAAAGASAVWLHVQQATRVSASAPATTTAASIASTISAPVTTTPSVESAAPEPAAVSDPTPAVSDGAAKPSTEQRKKDQLSAESALLTRARAELRKGNARGAEQLLNRLQAQFPKGVLGQEREVLAIEVLAARGNAAAAKRRAQAFIAAYPESPHSAQLSRFADAP